MWIVEQCIPHEGDWFLGVFTCKDEAIRAIEETYHDYLRLTDEVWEHPKKDYPSSGITIEIREVNVNAFTDK